MRRGGTVRLTAIGTLLSRVLIEVFVFCVGPAVNHQKDCSLSRLIVLTPL
jgi:hypothetical protein